MLGGPRFYLGRTGSAVTQLIMFIVGWATFIVGVGAIILVIEGIWVLVDAFLIPGMIQSHKDKVRQSLITNAMLAVGAARQELQM